MTFTYLRKKYNKIMKHLKTFEQLNEPRVEIGDTIEVDVDGQLTEFTADDVLDDGSIAVKYEGESVLVKFDEFSNSYLFIKEGDEHVFYN